MIELDDIGQETLRPVAQLEGFAPFTITSRNPEGTIRGSLHLEVDDRTYVAQVT